MCYMRRNGRCRASKHFGRECSIIHALFCQTAREIRTNDRAMRKAVREGVVDEEKEEERALGLGVGAGAPVFRRFRD